MKSTPLTNTSKLLNYNEMSLLLTQLNISQQILQAASVNGSASTGPFQVIKRYDITPEYVLVITYGKAQP